MGGTDYRGRDWLPWAGDSMGGTGYRGRVILWAGLTTVERDKNLSAANRGLWVGLTTVGG